MAINEFRTSGEGRHDLLDVSVVMPCLDEEARIGRALESLIDGFVRERGEVIVVDGGSRDRTREIAAGYAARGWPVRVLDNPGRLQSHGMNVGISASRGAVIARADAHSIYPEGYVRLCLALLRETGAASAGGSMWPVGETPSQKAIACAMRHPAGVGDAHHHLGNYSGWYDGAYPGVFRREVFEIVGGYDPAAHPNEDSELNRRILDAGLRIWLKGSLRVTYFPRTTLSALARQYFHYGRGRRYTARKHKSLKWRQAAPLVLVFGLAGSLLVAPFAPIALIFPAAYMAALVPAALLLPCGTREPLGVRARLVAAFAVMHVSWGLGFLTWRRKRLKGYSAR